MHFISLPCFKIHLTSKQTIMNKHRTILSQKLETGLRPEINQESVCRGYESFEKLTHVSSHYFKIWVITHLQEKGLDRRLYIE